MPTKDEIVESLARSHYEIEPGMKRIFRLLSPDETALDEPIKLLEISDETIAGGIVPIYFGPYPRSGVVYPSVIVSITPAEYERLAVGDLTLPHGWQVGQSYERSVLRENAAA